LNCYAGICVQNELDGIETLPAKQWDENRQSDWRDGLAYPFAKQMDTKKSLPRIARAF